MHKFRIEVVIEPDEGGFHAFVPALKGLHTSGETQEEALQNAKDAAEAYLRSLIKHGDPIPVGVLIEKEKGEQGHHQVKDLVVALA
jgi:predicted RNase H-like HicB family nuclease